jgi:hypothetical protein
LATKVDWLSFSYCTDFGEGEKELGSTGLFAGDRVGFSQLEYVRGPD